MLACLAALPAHAVEATDPFAEYQTMLKHLRANGIEPSQVAWAEVNPLCTGFMNYKDDQTAYNHCLYDKAMQAVAFATDRETCDIESLAVTPDSVRRQPRAIITEYTPNPADAAITTITTPRITRAELRTQRAATYNSCMRDHGWRSPRNWRLGYAE